MSTTSPKQDRAAETPDPERPSVFPPTRLLVPLDLSPRSLQALRHAEAFAEQFGARLHLLHVTEPLAYPTDLGYAPVISGELETELQEGSRERLGAVVEEVRRRGFAVESHLRVGRPHTEIAAAASELKTDLVVVTTHGFTGLKHVLLGSVAERVVRHAPCPVLVVREQERGAEVTAEEVQGEAPPPPPPATFRPQRVLVPMDFSEPSRAALTYAVALARQFRAGLQLVNVTELPYVDANLADVDTRGFEESTRQTAQAELNKLVESHRAEGLVIRGRVLTGAAWNETVNLAKREGIDLIVAGTHGYTGLKHVLLGSTAERLVRHAPCPVLVVRERFLAS